MIMSVVINKLVFNLVAIYFAPKACYSFESDIEMN